MLIEKFIYQDLKVSVTVFSARLGNVNLPYVVVFSIDVHVFVMCSCDFAVAIFACNAVLNIHSASKLY